MTIQIFNKTFKSKKELIKHTQSILDSHKLGERFKDDFINALLQNHPKADEKIGVGIRCLYKDMIPPYNKFPGLYIIRTDSSVTHISWRKCISIPSDMQRIKHAARGEIQEQIATFRFNLPTPTKCHITGETIEFGDLHVDHIIPFKTLFKDWYEQVGVLPESILVESSKDRADAYFSNKILSGLWRQYHKDFSELRPTTSKANLTREDI